MTPVLRTERLEFLPYRPEHEDAFVGLLRDEEVCRWMGQELVPEPELRELFRAILAEVYPNRRFDVWGLWLAGTYVGHAEVKPTGNVDGHELVTALAPGYWGRGLGGEVVRGLLRYAAEDLGLTEAYGMVGAENTASLAMCRRLGFRPVRDVVADDGSVTHLLVIPTTPETKTTTPATTADTPTTTAVPAAAEVPVLADASGTTGAPAPAGVPVTAEAPGTADAAATTDVPATADVPASTDAPAAAGVPATPKALIATGTPAPADTSATSAVPATAGAPGTAGIPASAEAPATTGVPNASAAPPAVPAGAAPLAAVPGAGAIPAPPLTAPPAPAPPASVSPGADTGARFPATSDAKDPV
ncbi:GNAT family N-acetyltransferase [Streptomyces sp. NPDC100445]|uniref:GNAT family N-acetyltransferase n=1 Tax=Streptomyces sp. NPDC100445 TaxID=3366102 RepID=UPI0038205D37